MYHSSCYFLAAKSQKNISIFRDYSNFSDGSKKSLPFLKDDNQESDEQLSISYQTETHLVSLLNQLCSRLMERDNAKLLDVFFHASQSTPSSDSNDTGLR